MTLKKAKQVKAKEDKALIDMRNRTGYFKEDDSGYWYFIPESQIVEFEQLDNSYEVAFAFAKYRIDGGPQSHKVFLIDKEK